MSSGETYLKKKAKPTLYGRLEAARKTALSVLQGSSVWPEDSLIAVNELMDAVRSVPDLQGVLYGSTPVPPALQESIEQLTSAMEGVSARLNKTYRKYGLKRDLSDVIKYSFASLPKDGCNTALRDCQNDVNEASKSLRRHLQNIPPSIQSDTFTSSSAAVTPTSQPETRKKGAQLRHPTSQSEPGQSLERRRARLDTARVTFETIEAVSGTIPVVGSYVGASAKVGLTFIKMVQTMDRNTETAKILENHTERLSEIIEHFKNRSTELRRAELQRHIVGLQRELLLVRDKVAELKALGARQRVVASANHVESLKMHQDEIRIALEELQLLVNINTTNLLDELHDVEIRKEQRRLLDRLGDASYGARGNAIKDAICLSGTRVEVLERIDNWIRNAPSERVMWIRGMAGRGKSTIASTVAHNWRYRAAIAIFHFRRGESALDKRLICSLARQLGHSIVPEIKGAVLQSIRENEDIAQDRLEEQFKILFVASAGRLQRTSHPILLIVDALDECEDTKYARDFLNLVHSYSSSLPKNFKFLLTTRPEALLLQGLQKRGWPSEDVDIAPKIDRDIKEFIHQRLLVIKDDAGLDDSWPSEASIRSLVDKSQGLFQWAQTALEYIAGGLRPDRELAELLESPVWKVDE